MGVKALKSPVLLEKSDRDGTPRDASWGPIRGENFLQINAF